MGWGMGGLAAMVAECSVIVVVDVLSFSTTVDVAVGRGGEVIPCEQDEEIARKLAEKHGAVVAGRKRDGGGLTLSPMSMLGVGAGMRVVVQSPNGAALSQAAAAGGARVIAGCLRNRSAVARELAKRQGRVVLLAAGERWADGSLRVALEDLLGVGAIAEAMGEGVEMSGEVRAAVGAYRACAANVLEVLRECPSGQELIGRGFGGDVELAGRVDESAVVAVLVDGSYRRLEGRG